MCGTIKAPWGVAITGANRGSSTEKIYQDFGLESLKLRLGFRKIRFSDKTLKYETPLYLLNMIPTIIRQRETRNSTNLSLLNVKHDFLRNTFFCSTIIEWNKLDSYICNSESLKTFKRRILMFRSPKPNSIYNIHNTLWTKHLTRLRVGISHIKEHKFRHKFNFQESVDPTSNCDNGVETAIRYFLYCPNLNLQIRSLFYNIGNVDETILTENDDSIVITSYLVNNAVNILLIKQH